jgi:ATP-dependent DNA ligase
VADRGVAVSGLPRSLRPMDLPVMPPVSPMLAKAVHGLDELPAGHYLYEPKWDGFRCIVFRDGDELILGSRNERPLTRYFPELIAPMLAQLPDRCVVDGEVFVATDHGLDFDVLSQRIHPAESRVNRLAAETPASFVAFDLLSIGDRSLDESPFRERRALLADALTAVSAPLYLTPATDDDAIAADWFVRFESAGFDGVMAKPLDGTYQQNKRVQFKVKHIRTADCVVAGYRMHKSGDGIGSLLLGLFDDEGVLHHVGVATSFTTKRRAELVHELAPFALDDIADHPWSAWYQAEAREAGGGSGRMPGAPSRWNAKKDLSWIPLRPDLVCEVAYDHLQGDRFRHATRLVRWRTDKQPVECTYDQLEMPPSADLSDVLGA